MLKKAFDFFFPCFLGILVFWLVTGHDALFPHHMQWISGGDAYQSLIGWLYFEQSPWAWPPGANPQFGGEFATSIFFSDSIPLFAIIFKILSPLIGAPFQYIGFWLLTCFVLQAFFAWRLLALISENFIFKTIGTLFFALSPPMLLRMTGHFALSGHFLILASFYLIFSRSQKNNLFYWSLLLFISSGIHSYLLAMVFGLALADLFHYAYFVQQKNFKWLATAYTSIGVLILSSLVVWGFFINSPTHASAGGYGSFGFNLVSLINPDSWSVFLKSIPNRSGNYEGFAYLGLGMIVSALCFLPLYLRDSFYLKKEWLPYIIVVLGFLIFAITNNITLGPYHLKIQIYPDWLKAVFAILRASGRFFWPIYYLIILAIFYAINRYVAKKWQPLFLIAILTLQLFDLHIKLIDIHNTFTRKIAVWAPRFQDPFWSDQALKYKEIWIIPNDIQAPGWDKLSYFGYEHHIPTNALALARVDIERLEVLNQSEMKKVLNCHLDKDTLYVLTPSFAQEFKKSAQSTCRDSLREVDGMYLLL